MKRPLLIPSVKKTWGTGHLVRCSRLLAKLGEASRILIPEKDSAEAWGWESLKDRFGDFIPASRVVHEMGTGTWDFVILDRRKTEKEEFLALTGGLPAIGLDEGGEARPWFSYLVDTFPRLDKAFPPNLADEGFLTEGETKAEKPVPKNIRKVLLTFGGEDPANLTDATFDALTSMGLLSPDSIDVVQGPAFHKPFVKSCGAVHRGLSDLKPLYGNYDLVLCSYGISAYEAAKEGVPVVVVNPTDYHERLTRKTGFLSLGVEKPDKRQLRKIFSAPGEALRASRTSLRLESRDLGAALARLEPERSKGCPGCGSRLNPAVFRNEERSFFSCSSCGLEYLELFTAYEENYQKDYFFEEYRKQYGKTYLEDFEKIQSFAKERLTALKELAGGVSGKKLLDVGCAYGPFLAEAGAWGLFPYGVDVAEDAITYVNRDLAIPAWKGDFLSFDPEEAFGLESFDVLTLWYVIEHFPDLEKVLRKASSILKEGGILAFSTPNGRGVSARFKAEDFFKRSPKDHYSVWNPTGAAKLLGKFGFTVRLVRVTGHHPERFPEILRRTLGEKILGLGSRGFGLGDTFEIYAEKKQAGERGD